MNELLEHMEKAPESQLDPQVMPLVRAAIDAEEGVEKATRTLELLDTVVRYSLASDFVVMSLNMILDKYCEDHSIDSETLQRLKDNKEIEE